tara:strand:+ start:57 stop:209 length:153 start_codon:yes stop_codon:yes gene_type:complete
MRARIDKFRKALEWRGVTAKDLILGGGSLALMAGMLGFIIWALVFASPAI